MYQRQIIFAILFTDFMIINSYSLIKATNLECVTSRKYFYNHSCFLKAVNRYKSVGFLKTQVITSLKNFSVNIALFKRNSANNYKPFMVNFTKNLCQFLDKKTSGLYVNIFMKILKEFSNVNHSCPYTGTIFANNIYLDSKYIPVAFITKTSFKFVIRFYEGYPFDYMGVAAYYLEAYETKKNAMF